MGWSCSDAAKKVLDLWATKCVRDTGMSNTYKLGDGYRFFEVSNVEHADGAITGTIMVMMPNMPDGTRDLAKPGSALKKGSFKIAGDGSYKTGPVFLKEMAEEAKGMSSSECSRGMFPS